MKGAQVATVAYIVAALLALAGFVHAFKTSREETFAAPAHANGKVEDKPLVGV